MMKRMYIHLSGILLCVVMLLALPMAVSAAGCETHDYVNGFCTVCGSYKTAPLKDGYYEIYTGGQLYWFAKQVRSGRTDMNGRLTADITINPDVLTADGELNGDGTGLRKWTLIGDRDDPYIGTFDGNGKTISGLFLDDGEAELAGLFGSIGTGGEVKDLTVTDSYFRIWLEAKAEIAVGGIAGETYGLIQGCRNEATVVNNEMYLGGIAGWASSEAAIRDCCNYGIVNGNYRLGGIVGANNGLVDSCHNAGPITASTSYCGGIVGVNNLSIINCHNSGPVKGSGTAGGIAGWVSHGFNTEGLVEKCYNTGEVTAEGHTGGIAGILYGGTITNCYNLATVSGDESSGGLVGSLESHIERCFSVGTVSGGGLFGWIYPSGGSYAHCYYLTGTASYDVGDSEEPQTLYARPAAFFSTGTLAWELNSGITDGSQVWYQDLGSDERPVFSGGTVYRLTAPCGTFSNTAGTVGEKAHTTTAVSCTDGVICGDCGDLLGHVYESTVTAPTCTVQGYTTYTCSGCGHSYDGDETDPVGHHFADSFCVDCGQLEAPQIQFCYSQKSDSVRVSWTQIPGADGYQLYRLDPSGTNNYWQRIKTLTGAETTTYTNQDLTVGKTYHYMVRAYVYHEDGTQSFSAYSQVEYMPAAVLFNAPYSNSASRIRLRWHEVDGAHGYQIWRKDEGGTYRVIKTIGDKGNVLTKDMGYVTAYSNTGLTSGAKYTYKIRAFRITDDGRKVFGPFYNEVTVAVQPAAPEFTVTSPAAGRAKIQWESVNGASGYQIWMSTQPDSGFTIAKSITSGDISVYNKYDLESGKTYYFKLRAYVEVNGKKTFGAYTETVAVTVR